MKKVVIMLIVFSFIISFSSCAQNIPASDVETGSADDTARIAEDTQEATDSEYNDLPNGVGGGGVQFGDFYKTCFCSVCFGYQNSAGEWVDFDGTFVKTRKDEVIDLINYYDLFFNGEDSCAYQNIMWYIVRDMGLTRPEVEEYNNLIDESDYNHFTEEELDALFIEDEFAARDAMRQPWTLFDGENIYRIVDIERMTKDEFASHNFSKEDVERLINYFEEYPDSVDFSEFENAEEQILRCREEMDGYILLLNELSA